MGHESAQLGNAEIVPICLHEQLLRRVEGVDDESLLGRLEADVLKTGKLELGVSHVVSGWIKYARLKHRPPHALPSFELGKDPFELIAIAGAAPVPGHSFEIETAAVVPRIHRLVARKCIFVVPKQRGTIALSDLPQALRKDRERHIVYAAHSFGREQGIERCADGRCFRNCSPFIEASHAQDQR